MKVLTSYFNGTLVSILLSLGKCASKILNFLIKKTRIGLGLGSKFRLGLGSITRNYPGPANLVG